tara:strand:+ start:577 stop:1239 length:663 start_codon:yes stop_codon:yes gene_type:complete
MNDLTLLIPAKKEKESLPIVLKEVQKYNIKKLVVLEKDDEETLNAIKNYDCKILFQKNKGYGAALIEGINKINSKYLCIFNADGSFDPKELEKMYINCKLNNFIFGSRYNKDSGSDDDTILTFIGNKIFSFIGNIFFKIKLNDILYTYILGETRLFKDLKLTQLDFRICVEIPINIQEKKLTYASSSSFERARIKGVKKVSEFKDGFKILIYLIKRIIKI